MLGRVRTHMLVSVLGVVVGIALIVIGRAVGGLIFGAAVPAWWAALSFIVGLVVIPVIGITSAFKLLRCPGCDGRVMFAVSAQTSPFARRYKKQCRHCGKTIFDGRLTKRTRIVQIIVFIATILFFGGMALYGSR